MKVTLVSSEDGDWEGIYVDGELKKEEHLLDAGHVLQALGILFEHKTIEMDGYNMSRLPLKESDLPC